jgi:glycine dehydrogenase subunit 1
MAVVQTGRDLVVVAPNLHPEYREVLECYAQGRGFRVRSGGDPDEETAGVIYQNPDFLGLVEDGAASAHRAHAAGALAIACVDPIALAVLAPPGEVGADIAVGEGQQLGLPASFGGPHVGFIACREELVRRLPGRLVGQAFDARGRRGFVLTLTAREQHIRREKATSNICTNHSLCALAASVYLTYLGPDGLRDIAETSFHRAHHLADRLAGLDGVELAFPEQPFFFEFPVRMSHVEQRLAGLTARGILGGLPVGRFFPDRPELQDVVTFCCTEVNDPEAIDELVEALR